MALQVIRDWHCTWSSFLIRGGTTGTPRWNPPSHQNINVLITQQVSIAGPCSAKNLVTALIMCAWLMLYVWPTLLLSAQMDQRLADVGVVRIAVFRFLCMRQALLRRRM